jgi:ribose transport system ATP-binding protein
MAEAVAAAPPRFDMRGIRKAFGATIAVNGVDLAVHAGEVCALVGQNGAGKSTLMSILSGAQTADDGSMRLDGEPFRPRNPMEARRAGVAMIYQELSIAPHLPVMENILLGVEPARYGLVDRARMRTIARDALRRLNHPEIDVERPAGSLSVAGQQVVEIARALAVGCRVLVLDEPTSSLGRADARRLFELIGELQRQGHAIVYISHFIEEVKEVATRILVLRDGRIVGGGPAPEMSPAQIVALMVGREVGDLFPRSPRTRGEAVLAIDGLLPDSAGFVLHRGEILGIAGLIGAGRTRLLRTIFGLEPVRRGRVRVAAWSGVPDPRGQWARGVGMLSEDRKGEGLAMGLSVAENLTASCLRDLGPGPIVLPAKQDAAAARWIDRVSIRCAGPRQPIQELSGGNQQKVALARLLHHGVDVLVLDEPTRGIDVGSKAQIYALMDRLVSEPVRAKAILLVSSYLPELLGLCDRIAVMRRGRLTPARPANDWDEHALMLAATTGAGEAA